MLYFHVSRLLAYDLPHQISHIQVSFHKYGEFFPGTGALDDIGYGKGKYYTVNVPLKDGMDDDSYKTIYEPVMQKVRELNRQLPCVNCIK